MSSISSYLQYWVHPTKHTYRQETARGYGAELFFHGHSSPHFTSEGKGRGEGLTVFRGTATQALMTSSLLLGAPRTARHLSVCFISNPWILYASFLFPSGIYIPKLYHHSSRSSLLVACKASLAVGILLQTCWFVQYVIFSLLPCSETIEICL